MQNVLFLLTFFRFTADVLSVFVCFANVTELSPIGPLWEIEEILILNC